MREAVSAPKPARAPAAAQLAPQRPAQLPGRGPPRGVPAPAARFEFGAVGVDSPEAETQAPRARSSAPAGKIGTKEPGQAAQPEVPAARHGVSAPPAAAPAAAAAALAPPPAAAHAAHPPAARGAHVPAAAWASIFSGLGDVAASLRAGADATRTAREPAEAGGRQKHADFGGKLEGLLVAAAELSAWSTEARLAAASAHGKPGALAALPLAAEAARIGGSARVAFAGLGAVRAAKAAWQQPHREAPEAFAQRMLLRSAALEQLLGRLRSGDHAAGNAVEATVLAAQQEAQSFHAPARLSAIGAAKVFTAAGEVGRALDEAGRKLPGKGEADGAAAAAPVIALLEAAAADAAAQGFESVKEPAPAEAKEPAPAEAKVKVAAAHRDEKKPAGRVHEEPWRDEPSPDGRKARPATWELHVARSSTEVGLEEVARALGAARLESVRDILAEGLTSRHQFVIWTLAGTKLTTALRALVDQGLIETRIQAP
jgi:hypothetical protein